MKKYYIYCGTENYTKNTNGGWDFNGGTSMNANDEYIGVYDTYEEAFKIYSSIELKMNEENHHSLYADYKQLYEFDTNEFSEDEIDSNELDLDKMKLLEDEFTYSE